MTAADKKKMSKVNAVIYNKLKTKVKKYLQKDQDGDAEDTYENQLKKYREEKPESESEEEEEEEDDDDESDDDDEDEDEDESESDDEEESDEEEAEAEAAKVTAKAEGGEDAGEEDEYDEEEYYDEEYDAEEEDEDEVDGDADTTADGKDIDPKVRNKYAFLFKQREEMNPIERRWKWVKKDCLPADLVALMDSLGKKGKKKKSDKERGGQAQNDKIDADEAEAETGADFVTQVNFRNDLQVDYSISQNVRERLEILNQERIKGKFSASFHVQVLTLMADQMKQASDSDILLKINVVIYLIGTLFQTTNKSAGFLPRD